MRLRDLSLPDIDAHIQHWTHRIRHARSLDERALALRVRDRWLDHRLEAMADARSQGRVHAGAG